MFTFRCSPTRLVRLFLLLCLVGSAIEVSMPQRAEARAGGGRSMGRSSGFGSRRAAPSAQPAQRPSDQSYNNPASSQPMGNRGGGFMRGLAGGIAGGFLGSMLFGSMGQAAGIGGAGGGMGLLEIIVIAGLAYFGFRWWKNRQQPALARVGSSPFGNQPYIRQGFDLSSAPALASVATIEPEEASDVFFRIQAAWTRRDLTPVEDLLAPELRQVFELDMRALRDSHRINRLENISIRRTDVTETSQEDGVDVATVRFLANLLDYTVDETSGQVVEGSDSLPVKFEEDWTFARTPGAKSWRLAGIRQV